MTIRSKRLLRELCDSAIKVGKTHRDSKDLLSNVEEYGDCVKEMKLHLNKLERLVRRGKKNHRK